MSPAQISRGGGLFHRNTRFFFLYSLTVLVQISRGGGIDLAFVLLKKGHSLPKMSLSCSKKKVIRCQNVAFVFHKKKRHTVQLSGSRWWQEAAWEMNLE